MDLDFIHIECEVVLAELSLDVQATLHESLWHFEKNFREKQCNKVAASCMCCGVNECLYRKIFERQLSSDPEVIRIHQRPSLPFSLYINEMDNDCSSSIVGLVIVGSAIHYADAFLNVLIYTIEKTFESLQQDKPVIRLFCLDGQGKHHRFSDATELSATAILNSALNILESPIYADHIQVNLKSPLRLLCNGAVAHSFDFATFVRSQMRRCSSLWSYYGTGAMPVEFKTMSRHATDIDVVDEEIRYGQPYWSSRPGRAGLTGTIECIGISPSITSILLLGSYFNAGKGAAFGLGFYRITLL